MRDAMKKTPALPWPALALLALLSVSCQFLGLDMYPPELQGASTSCDLPALVYEKTGQTFGRINMIRQLSSGATSLLFVLCETDSSNVVMVLDPETLAYRSHQIGVSTPFGVDAAGYFMAGNYKYDPATNPLPWPTQATAVTISDYSVLLVSEADLNHNVLLRSNGSSLSMMAADNPWPATLPCAYTAPFSSDSSGNWKIEDAAASSSETRLLLRRDSDGKTYYIDYPSSPYSLSLAFAGMSTGFLANTTSYQISNFDSQSDSSWLLDACIVYVDHDKESRIVRRRLTDGSVIDSHLIDSNWKESIYFEPTGHRWYYYDTRIGKLCVLRTWW